MAQYTWTYYNNQELPSVALDPIKDETGTAYDFSSGWTFAVRLCRANAKTTTLLLKTTGITGSSAGVVTIAWATTDWDGLEAATDGSQYVVYVTARRTSDSKDVAYKPNNPPTLLLKAAPGTSAVVGDTVAWPWTVAQPINAQTGTTYTLAFADIGELVTLTNASTITVTVDTNTNLAAGERIDLVQLGAGQVTVAASGVTVNATPGLKLRAQYSAATLICISTGVYVLVGDLSA